jgi:hypothetical protein
MTLVLNEVIAVSALIRVAVASQSMPRQEIAQMRIHQDLHVRGNFPAFVRPQDEVPVIRHQAERQDAHDGLFARISHRRQEPEVVSG